MIAELDLYAGQGFVSLTTNHQVSQQTVRAREVKGKERDGEEMRLGRDRSDAMRMRQARVGQDKVMLGHTNAGTASLGADE